MLPNDITVTIAYNTQSWGATPTGVNGPYSSLNMDLSRIAPTVGNEDISRAFWNTLSTSNYGDGGVVGSLREVHNSPQLATFGAILMTIKAKVPAATITAPAASAAWIGGGVITAGVILFGLAAYRRKRDTRH